MNVLIVKLTSMGDLVQSLPALSDARRARPEVVFDWVVDEAFAEVPGWHPAVGRVIKTAHRRWRRQVRQSFREGEVQAFWRQLRGARYAAVIDAQSNIKSAVVTALTRGPKHGPDRASVREYPAHWVYGQRHAIPRDQHAVTRWRQLFAAALGYPMPATAADFGLAGRAWPEVPGLPRTPYLVAVPNASWDNKYWLESQWRQLLALAGEQGYQVLLPWGSALEFERATAIARGRSNARVLPRHSLTELAAILRGSSGAVCMDTGLAHVAAALGVPTVTLYGPTDPALIGATGPHSVHVVADGFSCIPCNRRYCQVPGYRGPQAQCLTQVSGARVWQTLVNLMDASGGQSR